MSMPRLILALVLSLSVLVGCQKATQNKAPEMRAAVRAANGTIFDLQCLKGKSPENRSKCAVADSKGNRSAVGAYGDWYSSSYHYYLWELSYFDESAVCAWLFGYHSCYPWFGWQPVRDTSCQSDWIFYNRFDWGHGGCGNRWSPPPAQASCDVQRSEIFARASSANYCSQDSDCTTLPVNNSCDGAVFNPAYAYDLTAKISSFNASCERTPPSGGLMCPMWATVPPYCKQGRCAIH